MQTKNILIIQRVLCFFNAIVESFSDPVRVVVTDRTACPVVCLSDYIEVRKKGVTLPKLLDCIVIMMQIISQIPINL